MVLFVLTSPVPYCLALVLLLLLPSFSVHPSGRGGRPTRSCSIRRGCETRPAKCWWPERRRCLGKGYLVVFVVVVVVVLVFVAWR